MSHGGKDNLHQILGEDTQTGGVDAGMHANILALQNIRIHEKLYMVIFVIHQTQYTDRAGGDVQIFLHIAAVCKGQPGRADLPGKLLGLKGLVAGHHQQIKVSALPVAQ